MNNSDNATNMTMIKIVTKIRPALTWQELQQNYDLT